MNHDVAVVTPSYAADFERCRLLCDSLDANVPDFSKHYILVEGQDFDQFKVLNGKKRQVIDERDILPKWLHAKDDLLSKAIKGNIRRIWISKKTLPMRGWHVQQLRRIAVAAHVSEAGLLYCDSDSFFVRPFSTASLWQGDKLRLYRVRDGITNDMPYHRKWVAMASKIHGVKSSGFPHDDYINNMVTWKRENVVSMFANIEKVSGRDWVSVIGRHRTFSELMIYGIYVDEVLGAEAGHWHADFGLCHTYWDGDALTADSLDKFVDEMDERQVALGIQSFSNTDTSILRGFLKTA